jgi:hypothetical protein
MIRIVTIDRLSKDSQNALAVRSPQNALADPTPPVFTATDM